MVAGVEADDGSVTQGHYVRQGRAPVRNVGVVEGGFKELVLKEQALVWSQILIDNGQRVSEPFLPRSDRILSRVVRSVAQPDLERVGTSRIHDVDAAQVRVDGLTPHYLVGVRQRAELVVVILEDVRVDGSQCDALRARMLREVREVIDHVPRDV